MVFLAGIDNFLGGIKLFFFTIDSALATAIAYVYNFMLYCAGSKFNDIQYIKDITTNLYSLIGIFMLFFVGVQLIKSIVNPNELAGEKGIGKIASNIFVTLVLIVTVPWFFQTAMPQIQQILIGTYEGTEEGLIPALLTNSSVKNTSAGTAVSSQLLISFVSCDGKDASCNEKDRTALNGVRTAKNPEELEKYLGNIENGLENNRYNYMVFISMICLAGTLVLMVLLLFDVTRAVCQAWFLEIISPIPVMTYILPDHKMFSSWIDVVKNTYVSLFMRVGSLSLLVVVFNTFTGIVNNFSTGKNGNGNWILSVCMIIGMLLFIKEVPELVKNLFGIKDGIGMNPLSKMLGNKALGLAGALPKKALGATSGSIRGSGKGARAAWASSKGLKRGERLRRTIRGFGTGAADGGASGWNDTDASSSFGDVLKNANGASAGDRYGGTAQEIRKARRKASNDAKLARQEYEKSKYDFSKIKNNFEYGDNGMQYKDGAEAIDNVANATSGGFASELNNFMRSSAELKKIDDKLKQHGTEVNGKVVKLSDTELSALSAQREVYQKAVDSSKGKVEKEIAMIGDRGKREAAEATYKVGKKVLKEEKDNAGKKSPGKADKNNGNP